MAGVVASFVLACLLLQGVVTTAGESASTPAVAPRPAATDPTRVLTGAFPYGSALALDGAGHRHVVATSARGHLWYATDRTGGWQDERILVGRRGEFGWTYPSITVDEGGRVHIAVVRDGTPWCAPGPCSAGIFYLTDKGRARGHFGPPQRITGRQTTQPSLKVEDGVSYLAYVKPGTDWRRPEPPRLFFRTDRSGAWEAELVADNGRSPSLRVSSDGRPHIAWSAGNGVRYSRARTRSGGFAESQRIPSSHDGGGPSLALSASGSPQLAWVSEDQDSPDHIWYSRRSSAGWSPAHDLGAGWDADLSLDAQDRPHVLLARRHAGGEVVHRVRTAAVWSRQVVSAGVDPNDVHVRAYGSRATLVWSQGGGVWVARD
jgi:hypothetical protein